MALRAFFDESGDDPREKALVIAGWLADTETWIKFSDAWYRALHATPSIDYFKYNEAKGTKEQFDGWSETKVNRKLKKLSDVIRNHELRGFIGTAPHRVFAAIQRPKALKMHGIRAYHWGFHHIISVVLQDQLGEGNFSSKVDFVFDYHQELPACIKVYEEDVKPRISPKLKTIAGMVSPGDDKEIMALQASDLIAGLISESIKTGNKPSYPFNNIVRHRRIVHSPFQPPVPLMPGLFLLHTFWSMKVEASDFLKELRALSRLLKK